MLLLCFHPLFRHFWKVCFQLQVGSIVIPGVQLEIGEDKDLLCLLHSCLVLSLFILRLVIYHQPKSQSTVLGSIIDFDPFVGVGWTSPLVEQSAACTHFCRERSTDEADQQALWWRGSLHRGWVAEGRSMPPIPHAGLDFHRLDLTCRVYITNSCCRP